MLMLDIILLAAYLAAFVVGVWVGGVYGGLKGCKSEFKRWLTEKIN